MQKSQLTKEIVNLDLNKRKKEYIIWILVAISLIGFGIYDLIKDLNRDAKPLLAFSAVLILFGLLSLIHALKGIIVRNKYQVGEGSIKTSFYDQNRGISKVTINGLNGIAFSTENFSIGQSVYVVYNKKTLLACYSKDKYYL